MQAHPCAIRVAYATPAIPEFNFITKSKSRKIFKREEAIKKIRGYFDSPSALNIAEVTLYKKTNGNPKK